MLLCLPVLTETDQLLFLLAEMSSFSYSPFPRLPPVGSRLSPILEEDEKFEQTQCSKIIFSFFAFFTGAAVYFASGLEKCFFFCKQDQLS